MAEAKSGWQISSRALANPSIFYMTNCATTAKSFVVNDFLLKEVEICGVDKT